jgi:prepilin-type N-terminal cleavage/methylation domain-containing protein
MKRRSAFTLVELLATLVIIAVASGIIAPLAAGWWRSHSLQEHLDDLRTDWIKARTLAMDEGRPYRFQILSTGQGYRIAPNEIQYWPDQSSGVNAPPTGDEEEQQGTVIEKTLPNNLLFEEAGDAVNLSSNNQESTWLFLPDGRAKLLDFDGREHQQASIILHETSGQRRRQLTMRALTAQAQQTNLQQQQP